MIRGLMKLRVCLAERAECNKFETCIWNGAGHAWIHPCCRSSTLAKSATSFGPPGRGSGHEGHGCLSILKCGLCPFVRKMPADHLNGKLQNQEVEMNQSRLSGSLMSVCVCFGRMCEYNFCAILPSSGKPWMAMLPFRGGAE